MPLVKFLHQILCFFIQKVNSTFVTRAQLTDSCRRKIPATPLSEINTDRSLFLEPLEELFATGNYYPTLPVIRKLRQYAKSQNEPSCRKESKKGGRLSDGTFLVFCVDCRRCLGFHLMAEAEGPRTVRK